MKWMLVFLLVMPTIMQVFSQTQKIDNRNSAITLNDYQFIAPEGWQVQNNKTHILILNMKSGCQIQVLPPEQSTGDLVKDAENIFSMMYPTGWNYQKAGKDKYTLSKGYLPTQLEYTTIEATMTGTSKDGRYELEEGAALAIKLASQIVIIAVRHKSSMMGHDECVNKYETWRRFFNTFAVKNFTPQESTEDDQSKRIIGVWKVTGSGVVAGEYVFAANGNFQLGGGIGTSKTTRDDRYEYLHLSSYAFEGDGSYYISGNLLNFKNRGDQIDEQVPFRFEKVNHGGTGWNDRLYLLKKEAQFGKKYEACYEKVNFQRN